MELDQTARDSFHNASIALTKLLSRQLLAAEMTSESGDKNGSRGEGIRFEDDSVNSSSEDEIEEEDVHEMRAFM